MHHGPTCWHLTDLTCTPGAGMCHVPEVVPCSCCGMQVTVDDVEKLMEDSTEAQAQQDRLHEALASSLTPEQEAAAAEELAALVAKAEAEETAALDLPSVPRTEAQAQAEDAAALDLPSVPQLEVKALSQHRPAEAALQTRALEEPMAA